MSTTVSLKEIHERMFQFILKTSVVFAENPSKFFVDAATSHWYQTIHPVTPSFFSVSFLQSRQNSLRIRFSLSASFLGKLDIFETSPFIALDFLQINQKFFQKLTF